MKRKRCGSCKRRKSLTSFHRKGDGHRDRCKWCAAEYHRKHYEANKAQYIANAKKNRKSFKAEMDTFKDLPCSDCGNKYPPWVMDWDHRDGETKLSNVSRLGATKWRKAVIEEIAKCDLVCANCHRQRTHDRYAGVAER